MEVVYSCFFLTTTSSSSEDLLPKGIGSRSFSKTGGGSRGPVKSWLTTTSFSSSSSSSSTTSSRRPTTRDDDVGEASSPVVGVVLSRVGVGQEKRASSSDQGEKSSSSMPSPSIEMILLTMSSLQELVGETARKTGGFVVVTPCSTTMSAVLLTGVRWLASSQSLSSVTGSAGGGGGEQEGFLFLFGVGFLFFLPLFALRGLLLLLLVPGFLPRRRFFVGSFSSLPWFWSISRNK
mmetsp:Transcript_10239/g.14943  ORF Transcript_10239/g.14943 Transcript_10239/m.14943 type:complete len:235 (+) Transcript_10239:202-906(+)